MSQKDINQVNKLRSLFPQKLSVEVNRSKDGGFYAHITNFKNCYTEADSFSELIDMVNDAVRTYLEIPSKYLPFMPTFIPTIKQAQEFDAFPQTNQKGVINFLTTS